MILLFFFFLSADCKGHHRQQTNISYYKSIVFGSACGQHLKDKNQCCFPIYTLKENLQMKPHIPDFLYPRLLNTPISCILPSWDFIVNFLDSSSICTLDVLLYMLHLTWFHFFDVIFIVGISVGSWLCEGNVNNWKIQPSWSIEWSVKNESTSKLCITPTSMPCTQLQLHWNQKEH